MFLRKLFLILGVCLICSVPLSTPIASPLPNTFTNGQVADADQVNANFQAVLDLLVPVGAIIPWHKSFTNTPPLPALWVEANGQVLNDPESPFDGQTLPDLNGVTTTYGNSGLFVRGGQTSGTYQEDQLQSHKHIDAGHRHNLGGAVSFQTDDANGRYLAQHAGNVRGNLGHSFESYADLGDPAESTQGVARHGEETRPKNMSMVWIMRVK